MLLTLSWLQHDVEGQLQVLHPLHGVSLRVSISVDEILFPKAQRQRNVVVYISGFFRHLDP